MTIASARFQQLLNDFNLEQLFNEFGWDHASLKPQELTVSSETFTLTAIAQKRGVAVFLCTPDGAGNIPLRPTLLKIEKEATKLAHEHLLVFADAAQTMLTWLWVARVPRLRIPRALCHRFHAHSATDSTHILPPIP